MNMEERAAIRERCEAATPGPWNWDDSYEYIIGKGALVSVPTCGCGCSSLEISDADMDFIVHARHDIPALLDALDDAWIAISGPQDLPASECRVLALWNDEVEVLKFNVENKKFQHREYMFCIGVTHWMPLPEPPKQGGGDA